jgi:hypothetical protein
MGGGKVTALLWSVALTAALLAGCGGSKPTTPADDREKTSAGAAAGGAGAGSAAKDEPRSVMLTPDERTRLGITSSPAQAVTYTPSATAFATVLSHDSIAQAVADLETAASAAHLSQTALTRGKNLASGPGALSVDAIETLEKQSAADGAALSLAQRKLTAVLGVRFPWPSATAGGMLDALATGQSKLVRATFPSGALSGQTPKSLRLIPLDPGASAGSLSLTASPVWEAPQDAALPGRSFFALIGKGDVPEGLRLQAVPGQSGNGVAGVGDAGVLIPASAVVIANSQYWCYLEKTAGTFTRVAIDIARPLGDGYFVNDGVAESDPVVTSSAGLLLARETNSGSEPSD